MLAFAVACGGDGGPTDPGGGPDDGPAGSLFVDVAFPDMILAGSPQDLVVHAGYAGTDTTWSPGIAITVEAEAAEVSVGSGTTDAGGHVLAEVTADPLPASGTVPLRVEVRVTATDGTSTAGDTVEATILEPGLKAVYSTGVELLEGPVFHGWWTDCGATANNMYQGACADVADTPVNWAWGFGFTVEWTGYAYTRHGGTQRIGSYYWVDGDVFVELNGEIVGDISTPGGGYGADITLPPESWVPIHMTFGANGGSNNMQVGWRLDGAVPWEAIPKHYLGTPRSELPSPLLAPRGPASR